MPQIGTRQRSVIPRSTGPGRAGQVPRSTTPPEPADRPDPRPTRPGSWRAARRRPDRHRNSTPATGLRHPAPRGDRSSGSASPEGCDGKSGLAGSELPTVVESRRELPPRFESRTFWAGELLSATPFLYRSGHHYYREELPCRSVICAGARLILVMICGSLTDPAGRSWSRIAGRLRSSGRSSAPSAIRTDP